VSQKERKKMNEKAKQVLGSIEELQAIHHEVEELTALFDKKRGRNPEALQRIRGHVQVVTASLTPMLVEALHEPVEVDE
jgi:hypothetical protein